MFCVLDTCNSHFKLFMQKRQTSFKKSFVVQAGPYYVFMYSLKCRRKYHSIIIVHYFYVLKLLQKDFPLIDMHDHSMYVGSNYFQMSNNLALIYRASWFCKNRENCLVNNYTLLYYMTFGFDRSSRKHTSSILLSCYSTRPLDHSKSSHTHQLWRHTSKLKIISQIHFLLKKRHCVSSSLYLPWNDHKCMSSEVGQTASLSILQTPHHENSCKWWSWNHWT